MHRTEAWSLQFFDNQVGVMHVNSNEPRERLRLVRLERGVIAISNLERRESVQSGVLMIDHLLNPPSNSIDVTGQFQAVHPTSHKAPHFR
jgi:hypothetical protein